MRAASAGASGLDAMFSMSQQSILILSTCRWSPGCLSAEVVHLDRIKSKRLKPLASRKVPIVERRETVGDQRVGHDVVILVLAHKTKPLEGLLRVLDPSFRIIIHLDAKSDALPHDLPSHASVLDTRLDIFWGGFSMFRAIRALIDEAYRAVPRFGRAVLISGDSLPVVPGRQLHEILADHTREYIGLCEIPSDSRLRGSSLEEARSLCGGSILPWRFQNFCFYDNVLLNPGTLEAVQAKYDVVRETASYLRGSVKEIAEQLACNLPPRADLYQTFYYGEAWWALTRAALDLVVDDIHARAHVEFFRFLQAPEEHFIQTLLGNKRRALHALERQIICSPVFVDHNDPARSSLGHDALSAEGFRAARSSGPYLFARKYDPDLAPDVAAAIAEGRYFESLAGGTDTP